jgi:cytochrome P450
MNTATKALQTAKFLSGMYTERARVLYWAHVRGDLFSRLILPNGHSDPYEIYEEMRMRGPMLPTRLGTYSTTSHRLCNEVLRSRKFGVSPEDGSQDLANQAGLDLSLLELNPPDHTRIRRLAAPAFTPRRMSGYAVLVDHAVQQSLDECERQHEFDLMTSFAAPLPIAVVTHLLGLPNDPERFRRLGSTIARALDGIWSLGQARILAAADVELRATFVELLQQRAAEPGDDLVSALVAEQGQQITVTELSALVRLLLIAGFETTVNAIGNGMRWLLADRGQWELLAADTSSAAAVAEEVLRFDPPVQQTARVALESAQVGDVVVAKNQWVITLLAAANRDPEVYLNPAISTSPARIRWSIWPFREGFITASAHHLPGWS